MLLKSAVAAAGGDILHYTHAGDGVTNARPAINQSLPATPATERRPFTLISIAPTVPNAHYDLASPWRPPLPRTVLDSPLEIAL